MIGAVRVRCECGVCALLPKQGQDVVMPNAHADIACYSTTRQDLKAEAHGEIVEMALAVPAKQTERDNQRRKAQEEMGVSSLLPPPPTRTRVTPRGYPPSLSWPSPCSSACRPAGCCSASCKGPYAGSSRVGAIDDAGPLDKEATSFSPCCCASPAASSS